MVKPLKFMSSFANAVSMRPRHIKGIPMQLLVEANKDKCTVRVFEMDADLSSLNERDRGFRGISEAKRHI